jgi:ABC-type Zn2+ transport system substrate-binding protein/surface adhesin
VAIIEGIGVQTAILDPLEASIHTKPNAYADILKGISEELLECLGGSS